jgi:hypothetical protein
MSALTMLDLPNLPGVRRDVASANPKLYREFKASQSAAFGEPPKSRQQSEQSPAFPDDDDNSLMSYSFFDLTKSLSAFPTQGEAFNDLTGRYSLKSQQRDRLTKSRSLPYCSLDSAPPFVTNSRRVCRFVAYFEEETPENLVELVRSRQVNILFYPDDTTLEIIEPRVNDSGLQQGKVLKRHQVLKPKSNLKISRGDLPPMSAEDEIYRLEDFYCGAQLNIYNRIYTVIDCDKATQNYFDERGVPFGGKMTLPETFYDPRLRTTNGSLKSSSTKRTTKSHKSLDFFQYEKKVLRFYGTWDQRDDLFGDELLVRLHYSLADQTIEIVPIHNRNSGRDRLPKYLKKTIVLKKVRPAMESGGGR